MLVDIAQCCVTRTVLWKIETFGFQAIENVLWHLIHHIRDATTAYITF